jgi:uncharacterized protein (TIGR02231 family)
MRDTNIWTIVWVWLWTFLFLISPLSAWSAPREITFFPDSSQVVEVTKVKLQAEGKDIQKAIFVLPAQADPDSLVTRLPDSSKIKIEDQTWQQIYRQDDSKISDLRKQIDKLKMEKKSLQSAINALDVQIQFWQLQTKAKMKTVADANNMSSAIGKNIRKAYQDKYGQEPELEKLDKKIKELQDELERTVGKKETAWEVAVLLTGPQSVETVLTYTYSMSGCGWLPLYRLEARPKDGKIMFTWEAEIWQSSGSDWNNVATNLATLKPLPSISPSDLPPWVIKPRPVIHTRRYQTEQSGGQAKAAEDNAEALVAATEAFASPQQVRESTYTVWRMGKKSIPAGSRQRVKLQEDAWPTEFAYSIRPSLSPNAFVKASLRFPESKEIPSGSATFMIDGAILGKRNFAMAGKEGVLFFGIDPLVTAERILLSKKSGEKGILTDKQTYTWNWRIDVRNGRDDSVRVMIEDPNPQPRDERIKLTLMQDPEPAEKIPASLIWNLEMTAGQKKSILSSVSLEAPGDMNLDLGWQR